MVRVDIRGRNKMTITLQDLPSVIMIAINFFRERSRFTFKQHSLRSPLSSLLFRLPRPRVCGGHDAPIDSFTTRIPPSLTNTRLPEKICYPIPKPLYPQSFPSYYHRCYPKPLSRVTPLSSRLSLRPLLANSSCAMLVLMEDLQLC